MYKLLYLLICRLFSGCDRVVINLHKDMYIKLYYEWIVIILFGICQLPMVMVMYIYIYI